MANWRMASVSLETVIVLVEAGSDLDQLNRLSLQGKCGLPLSTYFSALKIRWLMENVVAVKKAITKGSCLFGTVDTWLIWVGDIHRLRTSSSVHWAHFHRKTWAGHAQEKNLC